MTLDYLRTAIKEQNRFMSPAHAADVNKLGPRSRKHQCEVDGCEKLATAWVADTYRSNLYFCSEHYVRATIPALDVD